MNPANALTLLSAASAMIGLLTLSCVRGPLATAVAVTCIGASLLLDRVDGAVARRLGLTSAMGAQLDTLSDLLAFGALPAALAVSLRPSLLSAACSLAYALGAVWRLARYDEGELAPGPMGPAFKGVPSAAGAAAVAVVASAHAAGLAPSWATAVVALSMAVLMPSTLRYPKRGIGAWPWMVMVPIAVATAWWAAR